MLLQRQVVAAVIVASSLLAGCGIIGGCAPKPIAMLPNPDGAGPPPLANGCAQYYRANGQDWYEEMVALRPEVIAALEPAGRIEGAVYPEEFSGDPALYSRPDFDAQLIVFFKDPGQPPEIYNLLFPRETLPTAAVCPYVVPKGRSAVASVCSLQGPAPVSRGWVRPPLA